MRKKIKERKGSEGEERGIYRQKMMKFSHCNSYLQTRLAGKWISPNYQPHFQGKTVFQFFVSKNNDYSLLWNSI